MPLKQRAIRKQHGDENVWKHVGVDITDRIAFRTVTPGEREQLAASTLEPQQFQSAIVSRLPSSLRDEAIWQYHVGRGRGVVFWGAGYQFRYVPVHDCVAGDSGSRPELEPHLVEQLESYDPVNEALLCSQVADVFSYFRIGSDGALFPLW